LKKQPGIRRAQSSATDPRAAVREFHTMVAQPGMTLVIFFCASQFDLAVLAEEMERWFKGVQVVGCTTAGEIGPAGCADHSISGVSFASGTFSAVSGKIDDLAQFTTVCGQALVHDLLQQLSSQAPHADIDNSFALLLIDGVCGHEEPVTRALQNALGQVPLVGGSAGDGLNFGATCVYVDGCFSSDAAILVLVSTRLPFQLFQAQHFIATEERVVVTQADTAHRLVREIDGWPAAQAYAKRVGVDLDGLTPPCFAASPMLVVIGGVNYVRSIRNANPDGSLTFFCAIDEGMVLRLGRAMNLMDNLQQTFAAIHASIGAPQLVIGFDCVLRRLEVVQSQQIEQMEDLFRRNNMIGFNSYGEQYRGAHVNQTFVGIAIGSAGAEDGDA